MQLPAEIAASRIPFRGRLGNARARSPRVCPRARVFLAFLRAGSLLGVGSRRMVWATWGASRGVFSPTWLSQKECAVFARASKAPEALPAFVHVTYPPKISRPALPAARASALLTSVTRLRPPHPSVRPRHRPCSTPTQPRYSARAPALCRRAHSRVLQ